MEVQAKKRKLLLIDDEPLMGVLLKNKFKLGYEVAVKLNGLEGLSFNAGADDFLIKPFNIAELSIRTERFFTRYKFDKL